MDQVVQFMESTPTTENYFRGVVLFGRNVASYKFALAKSLIELAESGSEQVSLEVLAEPFSRNLCEHLQETPKQATSSSSRFLDVCRQFNEGNVTQDELIRQTAQLGFANVIDAFHVVGKGEIPIRFFIDERKGNTKGIRLTDQIFNLATDAGVQSLLETEARWRLVENAWEIGITNSLISYDMDTGLFVPSGRRTNLSSARDTLNGYQKGRCFYCYKSISLSATGDVGSEVDHLFPHTLLRRGFMNDLDQVWNLVLACIDCNRGVGGKCDSSPDVLYVDRLAKRNDYLIESNLPIKETLILQTGNTKEKRHVFLQDKLATASSILPHSWSTTALFDPTF